MKEAYCTPDCAYKNRIFTILQDKLIYRIPGITSEELKKFSMQMYQENGSLDVWSVTGDHGHAVGIGQWNVPNAKKWLADNCAKNAKGQCDYDLELERQLKQLADDMAGAYAEYNGDVRLAIIDHNRPASAKRGVDQCLAGPTDYDDPGVVDCYYKDQVMRHDSSFELR